MGSFLKILVLPGNLLAELMIDEAITSDFDGLIIHGS